MEGIKDILREAIGLAKKTGLWQMFSLKEKEDMVRYFYLRYKNAELSNLGGE